jgi:hypothetical protein
MRNRTNAFCFFFWKKKNTLSLINPLGASPQTPRVGFAEFGVCGPLPTEGHFLRLYLEKEYITGLVPKHGATGECGLRTDLIV